MRGLIPTLICGILGCRLSHDEKGSCSRCGRLDADREKLLVKTLQRNRMLAQENASHMVRIRDLKRKVKRGE